MTEITREDFFAGVPADSPLMPEQACSTGHYGAWATADGMWAVISPRANPRAAERFFYGETAWMDARRIADDLSMSRRTR